MEIAVLAAVIPFILYFFRKIGWPLSVSMVAATILEIVNETVFAGVGTFYPEVMIPFPFFNFPVMIVLLGGFYSGVINFAALKISGFFRNKYLSAAVFLLSAALMNVLSIFVENIGIYSGFWVHKQASDISAVYFAVYIYYLLIVFPVSVFVAFRFLRRKS